MLRRFLCFALILCLLASYAVAEETQSAEPTAEFSAGSLYNGMEDGNGESDIADLQLALISLGLLTGSADGHFGDATETAVLLFQQMYGLSETGVADAETLAALSTAQTGVAKFRKG